MTGWLVYAGISALTIISPGPGVMMTLGSAMRSGVGPTVPGILGLSAGVGALAALSAAGLGALLATSPNAFLALKLVGAAYLVYLGVRLWRTPLRLDERADAAPTRRGALLRFVQGLTLQFTNPKPILFFAAVFPQFLDHTQPYVPQCAALIAIYSGLLVVIHLGYAWFAGRIRHWLRAPAVGRVVNRSMGAVLIGFAIALAGAHG